MKMKRVFSSLMALGLASTLVACGGGENKDDKAANNDADTKTEDKNEEATDDKDAAEGEDAAEESTEDFEAQTSDDTLVVGLGELNGDFLQGWTNNSGDVKVRKYLGIEGNNGYQTVVQDESGAWVNNTAVLDGEPLS
ncbi:MAG: ABC transporter substrate-binding protein, partial [Anaerococcus sp.]|nr:ABC transporter substrate-binding protein [Anaerococcus sp.]